MSEKGLLFTTGATGDGATAYTQAEVIRWQRQTFVGADNEGVAKDYLNELATTGTSSPVATNTGAAYVYGFPYWNTASVETAIPTPVSNTRIDRLVLRADWAAQTIRITRIAGTEGTGSPPSITQTDGTTWDIPLCQCSITTGGVITVTDEREFLHPNVAIDGDMVDDDAIDSQHYAAGSIDTTHLANDVVDDTKVGSRVPQFYRRQGGSATDWFSQGTTVYTPTTVRMQAGIVRWSGSSAYEGYVDITFNPAFSYKPLVFATRAYDATDRIIVSAWAFTASTMRIYWRDASGGSWTDVDFTWLAIGPE